LNAMRIVVFLIALVVMAIGIVGLVSPDTGTALRREYIATSFRGIYAIAGLRVALGSLLMLSAPTSRVPRAVRLLGALIGLQGLVQAVVAPLVGLERGRALLEWEAAHQGLLRLGALIALAVGGFMAFAVTGRPAVSRSARPK
jgi:hypothetical protein